MSSDGLHRLLDNQLINPIRDGLGAVVQGAPSGPQAESRAAAETTRTAHSPSKSDFRFPIPLREVDPITGGKVAVLWRVLRTPLIRKCDKHGCCALLTCGAAGRGLGARAPSAFEWRVVRWGVILGRRAQVTCTDAAGGRRRRSRTWSWGARWSRAQPPAWPSWGTATGGPSTFAF